uniref:Uncharacterized protein n=1 Tax=Myotis myotis TaxID=51298 RepID=A0A7J8AMI3_MYOMY|nr:hypothetical protein mMyoMyo1_007924 [Myotis myotis]
MTASQRLCTWAGGTRGNKSPGPGRQPRGPRAEQCGPGPLCAAPRPRAGTYVASTCGAAKCMCGDVRICWDRLGERRRGQDRGKVRVGVRRAGRREGARAPRAARPAPHNKVQGRAEVEEAARERPPAHTPPCEQRRVLAGRKLSRRRRPQLPAPPGPAARQGDPRKSGGGASASRALADPPGRCASPAAGLALAEVRAVNMAP